MSGIVERLLPARLGTAFRWLMASTWLANLGDGFAFAAGPLLVASQTRSATLVAAATLLQRLPWLLFAPISGTIADRVNRVVLTAVVELSRSGVLVLLALTIVTHHVDIDVVLLALFLIGTAEVFSDTAATTVLPSMVRPDDLPLANARVQTGMVTLYMLIGPPVGAALFATSRAVPFLAQAALVGAGAALMLRVKLPARQGRLASRPMLTEVGEGLRWVAHHPAVRTLIATIFIFNITFGAAWSVLVLYAEEQLRLGAIGYGLLTAASAVGGVLGTVTYGWITRRVTLGNIMRVGLIIETFTHLTLAITTSPAIALGIMVVFGAHAFVWGTTSTAVRQRAVPEALQGRVASVNGFGVYAGLVVGAALGGPIADRFGIAAPFWFAFVGSALFVALMWRQLRHIAHDDPE